MTNISRSEAPNAINRLADVAFLRKQEIYATQVQPKPAHEDSDEAPSSASPIFDSSQKQEGSKNIMEMKTFNAAKVQQVCNSLCAFIRENLKLEHRSKKTVYHFWELYFYDLKSSLVWRKEDAWLILSSLKQHRWSV